MSIISPAVSRLTLPGVPWLAFEPEGDGGTLTLGSIRIPVTVTREGGLATIEVQPGELTPAALGDAAILAALPEPLDGVAISSVRVTLDLEAMELAGVAVDVEATFAGAEVVAGIERDADGWTLSGGLAPESELTATAIAQAFGATLPSEVPELALSELELTVAGGELTIHAASSSEWTLPLGPDGIAVGEIEVDFQRGSDGTAGSIAGVVALGGVRMPISYSVPGGLRLAVEVDRVAPFELLQDVCGATAVGDLALPPEVLALAITDVEGVIDVPRRELSLAATGDGFERVQLVVRRVGATWGFAVGIKLDGGFELSRLAPELDDIELPDALIVVSSFDDPRFRFEQLQPIAGTGVRTGLLLNARLDLADLGADEVIGKAHLDVEAQIGARLSDLVLAASLGDLEITNGVVVHEAAFQLKPSPLAVVVLGKVGVVLDSSPLEFVGGLKVEPNGIAFQATMKGTWDEPFGAKGVAVSDVALDIGSSFEGVPSIGVTGGLKVGSFTGEAGVLFNSKVPSQSALKVKFNQLGLMDVIETFCAPPVVDSIPADVSETLSSIGLEDVDLYVVPMDTEIGQIAYKRGLRAGGTLHVAGLSATSKVEIDERDGIAARGSLSPIHVGDVFSLTGAGDDPRPGLAIEVRPTAIPTVSISGRAELLGMSASAYVSLSDAGFDLACSGKVFDRFECNLTAKGASLTSAEGFSVHADMRQDFLSDTTRRVALLLQQAGVEAQEGLAAAERDVARLQAEVARLDGEVGDVRGELAEQQAAAQAELQAAQAGLLRAQASLATVQAQIDAMRRTIEDERAAHAQKLRDAEAAVARAQAPVNAYAGQIAGLEARIAGREREIRWWRNWYDRLSWLDKAWGWTRMSAEIAWRGTEIASLRAQIGSVQVSTRAADELLRVAIQTLTGLRAATVTYPVEQDPRMLTLTGRLELEQAGVTGAQRVLEGTQAATRAIIDNASAGLTAAYEELQQATMAFASASALLATLREGAAAATAVAGWISAHGLEALVDVRRASFEGSLSATSGGSVSLDAEVWLMGEQRTVRANYDFHDVAAGAEALARQLAPSLRV